MSPGFRVTYNKNRFIWTSKTVFNNTSRSELQQHKITFRGVLFCWCVHFFLSPYWYSPHICKSMYNLVFKNFSGFSWIFVAHIYVKTMFHYKIIKEMYHMLKVTRAGMTLCTCVSSMAWAAAVGSVSQSPYQCARVCPTTRPSFQIFWDTQAKEKHSRRCPSSTPWCKPCARWTYASSCVGFMPLSVRQGKRSGPAGHSVRKPDGTVRDWCPILAFPGQKNCNAAHSQRKCAYQ